MTNQHAVLIVGVANQVEILALNHDKNIVFAANYEEATELLRKAKFGHVITDAVLEENKTGFDIVQEVKNMAVRPSLVVCHHETMCRVRGRNWNIPVSLSVCFKDFATFHQGSILDHWAKRTSQLKKCA